MDVVDAYVTYCSNHSIPVPVAKMESILREKLGHLELNARNVLRVHRLRMGLVKLYKGNTPKGAGDKFDEFCRKRGRVRPTQEQIDAMNEDPFEGSQSIRLDPDNPRLYKALVTFRAQGGF